MNCLLVQIITFILCARIDFFRNMKTMKTLRLVIFLLKITMNLCDEPFHFNTDDDEHDRLYPDHAPMILAPPGKHLGIPRPRHEYGHVGMRILPVVIETKKGMSKIEGMLFLFKMQLYIYVNTFLQFYELKPCCAPFKL